MDRHLDGRMLRFPLYSTGHRSLWVRCPKTAGQQIKQPPNYHPTKQPYRYFQTNKKKHGIPFAVKRRGKMEVGEKSCYCRKIYPCNFDEKKIVALAAKVVYLIKFSLGDFLSWQRHFLVPNFPFQISHSQTGNTNVERGKVRR